jgi:hypothetical protein
VVDMDDSRLSLGNSLSRAVTLGVLSSAGIPQLKPFYPTADCNWPPFSSLGVCSRCIDLSAQVQATQDCKPKPAHENDLWCVVDTNSTGSQTLSFSYRQFPHWKAFMAFSISVFRPELLLLF